MITASLVLFHNKKSDIDRLMVAVRSSSIDRLFVVDNSSNDFFSFLNDDPLIDYRKNKNIGYGGSHNIAIREAIAMKSDYHVVLNPDVYWESDIIKEMQQYAQENPSCGLIMPKVLYPDGNIQYLCKLLPTPMDLFGRRFICLQSYQKRHDMSYELQWTGYDRIMEVPSLSGCFMFMRTNVLKQVGGFDERFFMYAEDLDLCRRLGEISSTIYYPLVSIVHEYEKGSYKNKKLLRYHICSVVKYFNKWGWLFDSKRSKRNRQCVEAIKKQMS